MLLSMLIGRTGRVAHGSMVEAEARLKVYEEVWLRK